MDDANLSNQVTDDVTDGEILSSLGVDEPTDSMLESDDNSPHMPGDGNQGNETLLPAGVKARLGRQEKRHQREMRQMREQMEQMQNMFASQPQNQSMNDPYGQQGNALDDVDPQIHRAVSYALQAQEAEKRKAKDREEAQVVQKKYQALHESLDKGAEKYEDFDEVVRGQDAPFTPAMRDAALFLDNAPDVLYKLGKNKEELKRIVQLHPLDQAREMVKLSHALRAGNNERPQGNNPNRSIGQIKSNPVSNHGAITNNTPASEIRRRMKAGHWK